MLDPYLPIDRRYALSKGTPLPDRTQGAALFADISGFTPLTQALARELGSQKGAEELTLQLNQVYGALIAEVHRYHGAVIGFSGDAITCWLDSDDGLRATACAMAMQERMEQFAQVETPGGTVISLGIKVAAVRGPVRRFLVGDPAIQRVEALAGATMDRMATGEGLAKRGDVVIGAEIADRLGERLVIREWRSSPDKEQFAVVAELKGKVGSTPWLPIPPLDEEVIRQWVLPAVYRQLKGYEAFAAELRPAVAQFVKFTGIDYDQDDQAGAKLDAYVRWAQEVVESRGGTLLQLTIGDKGSYLYNVFGAPVAHEDDPARAVVAALDLRTAPAELDFIRDIHIGISRGLMRTGAYGGESRRTYGVLGNDVNIAARLMGQAQPGQILVSARIANAVRSRYDMEDIGTLHLKGLVDPLPVLALQSRRMVTGVRDLKGRPLTPLVGRKAELNILTQRIQSLLESQPGGTVIIEGEAGIGKSRLVMELLQQAQTAGIPAMMGTGQSTEQQTPYRAWRDILISYFDLEPINDPVERQQRVLTRVQKIAPDQVQRLPLLNEVLSLELPETGLTASLDPSLRQQSLFLLLTTLLRMRARETALILVLEDAHWLDSLSWELVTYVARDFIISGDPFLMLVVPRPLDKHSTGARQITSMQKIDKTIKLSLDALQAEETVALATSRLGLPPGALPEPVADVVRQRAGGNPFFAEELILNMRDQGVICIEPTPSDAETVTQPRNRCTICGDLEETVRSLPDTIQGLVLARIDRLPPERQMALKVAAVIGRTFAHSPLRHTLQQYREVTDGELRAYLDTLVDLDLTALDSLEPERTYIFKHITTQEAAYQTLLFAQRRQLHRVVAEWYEATTDPQHTAPLLAHHYHHAEDAERERYYARIAGEQAATQFANAEAVTYFSRALELTPEADLAQRYALRLARERVYDLQGEREAQKQELTVLTELAHRLDVPHRRAQVALRLTHYAEVTGDFPAAVAAAQSAIRHAQTAMDVSSEAAGHRAWGQALFRQGDYEGAKRQYRQTLDLFEGEEALTPGETRVLAQTLHYLGSVYRQQGNFDAAKESYVQALTLSQEIGDRKGEADALNSLGVTAHYQRHFTPAIDYYRQAIRLRRIIGDRAGRATTLFNLAWGLKDIGQYNQAEKYLYEALSIHQAIDNKWEQVNVWNGLGTLYQELGNLSRAFDCLNQGLQLSREIGDEAGEAYLLATLGLVADDQGDLLEAERLLTEGLALAQAQEDTYLVSIFYCYQSHVSLELGRLDEAIERANTALRMHQEIDARLSTPDDLSILAASYLAKGDLPRALDHAQQALAILDECGGEGPEFPQHDYFVVYQVLLANDQIEEARRAFRAAHQLVMDRAEKITDPDLRRSFLEQVPTNRKIMQELKNHPYLTASPS